MTLDRHEAMEPAGVRERHTRREQYQVARLVARRGPAIELAQVGRRADEEDEDRGPRSWWSRGVREAMRLVLRARRGEARAEHAQEPQHHWVVSVTRAPPPTFEPARQTKDLEPTAEDWRLVD